MVHVGEDQTDESLANEAIAWARHAGSSSPKSPYQPPDAGLLGDGDGMCGGDEPSDEASVMQGKSLVNRKAPDPTRPGPASAEQKK